MENLDDISSLRENLKILLERVTVETKELADVLDFIKHYDIPNEFITSLNKFLNCVHSDKKYPEFDVLKNKFIQIGFQNKDSGNIVTTVKNFSGDFKFVLVYDYRNGLFFLKISDTNKSHNKIFIQGCGENDLGFGGGEIEINNSENRILIGGYSNRFGVIPNDDKIKAVIQTILSKKFKDYNIEFNI